MLLIYLFSGVALNVNLVIDIEKMSVVRDLYAFLYIIHVYAIRLNFLVEMIYIQDFHLQGNCYCDKDYIKGNIWYVEFYKMYLIYELTFF